MIPTVSRVAAERGEREKGDGGSLRQSRTSRRLPQGFLNEFLLSYSGYD